MRPTKPSEGAGERLRNDFADRIVVPRAGTQVALLTLRGSSSIGCTLGAHDEPSRWLLLETSRDAVAEARKLAGLRQRRCAIFLFAQVRGPLDVEVQLEERSDLRVSEV